MCIKRQARSWCHWYIGQERSYYHMGEERNNGNAFTLIGSKVVHRSVGIATKNCSKWLEWNIYGSRADTLLIQTIPIAKYQAGCLDWGYIIETIICESPSTMMFVKALCHCISKCEKVAVIHPHKDPERKLLYLGMQKQYFKPNHDKVVAIKENESWIAASKLITV